MKDGKYTKSQKFSVCHQKALNDGMITNKRKGRVDPPSFLRGRRRILSAGAIADLRELIHESPELFLDELRLWLALYHDIQISTTALHDNLRQLGLTRKLIRRAAAERDHELRANWMYNILL